MNGTDWPSPAANLVMVEQQIKKILAETGVDVPSLAAGILFTSTSSLHGHVEYSCLVSARLNIFSEVTLLQDLHL